jgi:hypothetical protein
MKTLPAFPTDPSSHNECDTGMTLRDYFAAKAMQSMNLREDYIDSSADLIAMDSYFLADAMLKARKQT